jgi:hypothetical protein
LGLKERTLEGTIRRDVWWLLTVGGCHARTPGRNCSSAMRLLRRALVLQWEGCRSLACGKPVRLQRVLRRWHLGEGVGHQNRGSLEQAKGTFSLQLRSNALQRAACRTVRAALICPRCGGTKEIQCPSCTGQGERFGLRCLRCVGRCEIICPRCKGKGTVSKRYRVSTPRSARSTETD